MTFGASRFAGPVLGAGRFVWARWREVAGWDAFFEWVSLDGFLDDVIGVFEWTEGWIRASFVGRSGPELCFVLCFVGISGRSYLKDYLDYLKDLSSFAFCASGSCGLE